MVVAQLLSHVQIFVTSWAVACQASLSFTVSHSLLKLMSAESVMPSSHIILCCPLLLLSSIFPSLKVFSNVSALCIRWPKYWSFSFSISPSNEYSGLTSFRISLLFKELSRIFSSTSSKASTFGSQPSLWSKSDIHIYITTRKYIVFTRWTFVREVIFLLFNTVYICHSFSFNEQLSFNFMTAVTVHDDSRA